MSRNRGSSMTYSCKGSKLHTWAQRRKMPWTRAREILASCVLSRKDNRLIEGVKLVEGIQRSAQLEPIEALNAIAAQHDYNVSTGRNLFQLAAHLPHDGRGQRFFRPEWREGTYEKYVTLSAVHFEREGFTGVALGYITFHGESTIRPAVIAHADMPGWVAEYKSEWEVPFTRAVPPPPSIGTDVPVDPATYRLRAYPGYDAPNNPSFVDRLLRDRGVIPDLEVEGTAADGGAADGGQGPSDSDGSIPHGGGNAV